VKIFLCSLQQIDHFNLTTQSLGGSNRQPLLKKVSSSMVFTHQNIDTRTNYTGCGGHVSGCSGFDVDGVASGCLDIDDQASSLANWAMMVTLDVSVYFGFLGADNAPFTGRWGSQGDPRSYGQLCHRRQVSAAGQWGEDGDIGWWVEFGGPPGGDLEASRWS
jgi:hypothetical protein